MNIFLYLDRDTWVHRLDPRTKMGGAVILFSLALCFNHPLFTGGIALGVLAFCAAGRALPNVRRFRYLLVLLFVFSASIWPFFAAGPTTWFSRGPLVVSRESFLYGVAMGLRLDAFVMTGLLLLSTTRNEELTNGLIRLGVPYPLAFAFSTSLRLIPTLAGAGATIIQAQSARGLDLESGNIFRRIGKFIPQAVPLFLYAVRYTNQLAIALESRGFSPGSKRTFYYEPRMGKSDWAVIAVMAAALAFALYLRVFLAVGVAIPGRM
ncbi:MAG TPA: energy-coupling factor transporter transmembrane component T [Thermodesulfobacteriota bacterium]|nr:energy-coupling factor transporter transmembrane component T [Thermodesulfobacteriota bacterium]